jgi:cold shock CspA family protein
LTEEVENPEPDDDVPPNDRFSRGKIVRFFPKLRYGFIKDGRGRDVYFNLDEVRFFGDKDHRDILEGAEVGYDISRTSRGEHVIKMKIY